MRVEDAAGNQISVATRSSAFVWSFASGFLLFTLIRATVGLRAGPEDEVDGLDLSEHGSEAYPADLTAGIAPER